MTNGNASLTNGSATWIYGLGTAATQTTLTVTDANGKVVYSGTGETASGNHQFNWNGKDNNGNQLADGTYKLTVGAKASDGSAVTSPGRQRRRGERDRHDLGHAATDDRRHGNRAWRHRQCRKRDELKF